MQNLYEADILSQDFNLCQQCNFKLFYWQQYKWSYGNP